MSSWNWIISAIVANAPICVLCHGRCSFAYFFLALLFSRRLSLYNLEQRWLPRGQVCFFKPATSLRGVCRVASGLLNYDCVTRRADSLWSKRFPRVFMLTYVEVAGRARSNCAMLNCDWIARRAGNLETIELSFVVVNYDNVARRTSGLKSRWPAYV